MNAEVVAFGGNFSIYFMVNYIKYLLHISVYLWNSPMKYTILVNFVNSADQVAEGCVLFGRFQGVVERRPFTL